MFMLEFLKKSVRADDTHLPVQNDSAFVFSDTDLEEILKVALLAQCPSVIKDIDNIELSSTPTDQAIFVILKAKQEIYYRLASSSAPFYPIEAEGASLRKDVRFEHYMSLVRKIEQEYQSLWDKYLTNKTVDVGEVTLARHHFRLSNFNKASAPTVEVLRVIPHSSSIDIEWSKFEVFAGIFSSYKVYIDTVQIYDEFESISNDYDNTILVSDDNLSKTAKLVQHTLNIHGTKFRIKELLANTKYHILIISSDRNGLKGYVEVECTTLPLAY